MAVKNMAASVLTRLKNQSEKEDVQNRAIGGKIKLWHTI